MRQAARKAASKIVAMVVSARRTMERAIRGLGGNGMRIPRVPDTNGGKFVREYVSG
jgi:hypothetical protein